MKLKKLLVSIDICLVVLSIVALIIFSILGKKDRVGYLSNISLDINKTIKNNHLNVDNFIMNNKDIEKYIVTNNMITDYTYNFRISYYDKVFRNSDIYGVYIVEDSLPDYIKNIEYKEKGSPFGTLVSTKKLEKEKIDNIRYILIVKFSVFIRIILLLIVLCIFVYFFMIDNFIKFLKRFDYKNEYFYRLTIFLCFLILPNIVYVIFYNKFDHTNYENRKFFSYPIFSLTEINKYPKLFETYFNDHLSFRNELIQLNGLINYNLFCNFFNKAIILDNGDISGYPSFVKTIDDKKMLIIKNNILKFKEYLNNRGIELLIILPVDKKYIYSEYYPKYINKQLLVNNDKEKIFDELKSYVDIIFPKNELMKYKDIYRLYYEFDDHWNNIGGYIVYITVLDKLKMIYKKLNEVNITRYNYIYQGSIGIQIANSVNISKFLSQNEFYTITNYSATEFNIIKGDIYNWGTHIITSSDTTNNINVAFLRDSMTEASISYFSSCFKNTYYFPWGGNSVNKINFFKNIDKYNLDIFFLEINQEFSDRLIDELSQYNNLLSLHNK
ncbi:hypothetical protein A9X75_11385 [Brachyspira hyodysenteriae]|uniref:hypothetical protein n=1 Tax=Brachyspira hyodysenteriae TaxID=159 RepID=UPI001183AC3B|nr:hypothetical protein [Brachyspira hyodysenteriae]TVL65290.1 hypothetical protein A9X75_11385 [Brachyspira hyodysenteriae]TVL68341.1 hypothetical protein A9X74_12115 [Brachyspira hyodysenteriae]